jgi:hypothetical protein
MKFRKKPVVIEAMQWNGSAESIRQICQWANARFEDEPNVDYVSCHDGTVSDVLVHTLEGEMQVSPGDWIIKGVKGEFYPCKPDIFEQTYERVD